MLTEEDLEAELRRGLEAERRGLEAERRGLEAADFLLITLMYVDLVAALRGPIRIPRRAAAWRI